MVEVNRLQAVLGQIAKSPHFSCQSTFIEILLKEECEYLNSVLVPFDIVVMPVCMNNTSNEFKNWNKARMQEIRFSPTEEYPHTRHQDVWTKET